MVGRAQALKTFKSRFLIFILKFAVMRKRVGCMAKAIFPSLSQSVTAMRVGCTALSCFPFEEVR
jgi:hypothetical protein